MKQAILFFALTLLLVFSIKPSYCDNYYVSPSGNDSWSGTVSAPTKHGDGPFRTIARAVAAMGAGSVRTTYVREGEYVQNGVSISLNSQNSGDLLLAYPGEHPIISGGFQVRNWQQEPSIPGAWSAPLPADFNTSSVTGMPPVVSFNGQWMDCARTPNVVPTDRYQSGYFYAAGPVNPSYPPDYGTDNTFTFRNADINPNIYNGEPTAGIVMWDKLGWLCDPMLISSIDFNTSTVNLQTASTFGISNNSRYYIYGTKGSLDIQGEYFMDAVGRRLWIIPYGGVNPNNATVVISQSEGPPVIEIDGANNVLIQGFQIKDQDNSDRWDNAVGDYAPQEGGIRIDAGQSDVIENNIISCTGIGIVTTGGSGALIYDNEIYDTVGGGMSLYGTGDIAVGNYIHDIGLLEQGGGGIWSAPAPNYIGYNLVDNTPAEAVISGNGSPAADGLHVEYNGFLHTSQGAHDTGAVYLKNQGNYTASNPEIVRYNSFRDTGGFIPVAAPSTGDISTYFPDWSWAIYLDNGQSGTDVYGNLVNISGDGGVFAHLGINNNIYNNVIVNATGYSLVMQGTLGDDPLSNIFTDNIFYGTVPIDPVLVEQSGTQGLLAKNMWWNPNYSNYDFSGAPFADYNDTATTQSFGAWQTSGEDSGSLQADPQFVNPGIYDFALQRSSPAFRLGFQPLPLAQIGPQGYKPTTIRIVPNNARTYTVRNFEPGSVHVVQLTYKEVIVQGRGEGGVGNVRIGGSAPFSHPIALSGPRRSITTTYAEELVATANSNGQLVLNIAPDAGGSGGDAHCTEIVIDPPDSPKPIVQIHAGGPSTGGWAGDRDFRGGKVDRVTDPIDTSFAFHAAPAAVYDTCRYGTFSYSIPGLVPGSTHLVRLHFSEPYLGIPGRGVGFGAGTRVFNVTINGEPALTNFDVYAVADGPDTAVSRQFIATASASGSIVISFAPAAGSPDTDAIVSGIEVY